MTYAIVETGGKQLWAEPGRFYDVELLTDEPESVIDLSNVLLVNDGSDVTVGQPYIEGAVVKARVMQHRRGPKVIVYKMKPKKKTRKKKGHRQSLTRLMIESIELGGQSVGGTAEAASTAKPAVAAKSVAAAEPSTEDEAIDVAATAESD